MKQILVMMAAVVLVGCGEAPVIVTVRDSNSTKPLTMKEKAKAGDPQAQYNLGLEVEDDKEAVKWFRKAAEQGHAGAQNELGAMYFHGEGVSEDFKESVKWFRKAADQGNAAAQYNLGVRYAKGQGVVQNFNEAFKLWKKISDQGYADAQASLGWMYYLGDGVSKDYATAYAWGHIAETNGSQRAKNNKNEVANNMTPAQIAEAEELVKEMIKKNPKLLK